MHKPLKFVYAVHSITIDFWETFQEIAKKMKFYENLLKMLFGPFPERFDW